MLSYLKLFSTKIKVLMIILFLMVCFLVAFALTSSKKDGNVQPGPSASQIDFGPGYNGPLPSSISQIYTENDKQILERDELIGKLIKKLPFSGREFTLSYDYKMNKFFLFFEQNNEGSAMNEFNAFLKENKIEQKEWLYNLTIKNE